MDDSAFVVRVKFMARPGEKFILRKEIFRGIQEGFKKAGISFASRHIVIDGPADLGNRPHR